MSDQPTEATEAEGPAKGSALYRATQAVRALKEAAAALLADDVELLTDMIEGETELFECFDRMLLANEQDEQFADACDRGADLFAARAKRFRDRIEQRRTMIAQAMTIAELNSVKRPAATLTLAERAPSLIITEEADIPAQFWKTGKPTLDKKAVKAALEAEEAVPGALLSNAAPTLTIRRR